MTRTRIAIAAAAALGLGILLAVLLWPSPPAPPRARQYTAQQACLLTDQHGVNGPEAAEAWAALQQASTATSAKVTSLPVVGEPTLGNALPYATTLVARHCTVVVAATTIEAQAIAQIAPAYPKTRFLVVGTGNPTANLTVLAPSSDARTHLADTLTATLKSLN
ncbi:BMP family ABC transporter substrate-binding protein [Kitasatospora sp. NPDC051914]|uniref:BMP family ABC transporter substrate-binding protein n=1 Tax=Kitasatospora sp. NPDC051914 TaxID=3154945 RepID=UPI0034389D24